MTVTLTNDEGMAAACVASLQMLRKLTLARQGDHGGQSRRGIKQRWADTIHGLMGEIAVAKCLGKTWTPGGSSVSTGEIAGEMEVRATEYAQGHLLVYASDADNAAFWLVRGSFHEFDVVGWVRGRDAKRQEWLRPQSDPPCYWVPAEALNQPHTFTTTKPN